MSKKPDHAKHSAGGAGREALAPDMLLFIRLVAATVIFAVSLIVKMPAFASILLLVLSAAVAGYDICLQAVNSVENGDYFATPLVVVFIAAISYVIGFASEGAALILLYQIGLRLIAYAAERTRKSAIELLRYQDEETVDKIKALLCEEQAGYMEIESTMRYSSGSILKIAMIFAVVYAITLPLFTSFSYTVSIHRALTIILIATPMSVVAAMPSTGIVGLCYSAQQGVLFNKAATMEATGKVNIAIFDKAGIFSEACPRVLSVQSDVLDSATFMNFAAHAVYYSEQPIARAIAAVNDQEYRLDIISDFVDIPGRGVDVKIGGAQLTLATSELFASRGVYVPQSGESEGRAYYMTVSDRYVGKLVLSSDVNDEAAELAEDMKELGVKRCILLTEEGNDESQQLAEVLGFNEVYGQCDTEKKLRLVSDLSEGSKNRILFVYSSGIESHSSAAVDMRVSPKAKYADATVLPDFVANIPFSIQVCRRMREIAVENAVFAFVIKAILIFLSIVGFCNVWFAIFIDMAAALATILNSIRVTNESLLRSFQYKRGK
ncbi:MAG: HAD family hydrolase [Oscillospiraceae bacterium]|nr:HAD family hydrolase [Oscillospiraceae bacterium]